MTQEQIKAMIAAQAAQYKAMGMDDQTIKMMTAQMEMSYQMMYGTNNQENNMFSGFDNLDYDAAMHSNADEDEEECNLNDVQKYLVGCGLILAVMNSEDIHTLQAGDSYSSNEKLSSWWGLNSKSEVLEKIDLVLSEGHRFEFDSDPRKQKVIKQISKLAAANNVATPNEILAWDYCRVIGLCRWAIDVNYFTEDEAQEVMTKVARKIQQNYNSWSDMGIAYLLGRAWWGGEDNIMEDYSFNTAYQSYIECLQASGSYWNTVNWNTKL